MFGSLSELEFKFCPIQIIYSQNSKRDTWSCCSMRDSSYLSIGLPTTQGKTDVGKFSPAKPHLTYCKILMEIRIGFFKRDKENHQIVVILYYHCLEKGLIPHQ